MLNYRLYFIDNITGHIDRVEAIAASDDDVQAVSLAGQYMGRQAMELWNRQRKIHRFEPVSGPVKSMGPRPIIAKGPIDPLAPNFTATSIDTALRDLSAGQPEAFVTLMGNLETSALAVRGDVLTILEAFLAHAPPSEHFEIWLKSLITQLRTEQHERH